ncbi:MAG: C4-dicarboxylate ABC transporter, partial [Desulfobulbaceae bacterium]
RPSAGYEYLEAQQATVQAAADAAAKQCGEQQVKKEKELQDFLKEQGLQVYEPDLDAFRARVQKMYLESEIAESWPEGLLDKINSL